MEATHAAPMAPTGESETLSDDYLRDVFANGGILSKAIEGYSMRLPQVQLAKGVHNALRDGSHLVAEAPTGTGKSLAYSVPASWYARKHGRRVLICTANIALQEQLVSKDLPMLAELLPWRVRFALAKGRSNYLCPLAHEKNAGEVAHMPDVLEWINSTATGDFSELAALINDRHGFDSSIAFGPLRGMLSMSSDECIGRDCAHYEGGCFANRARARAEDADIVVSNYHLLFAHLRVMQATEGNVGVLPPFDVVIWDEAHKAADIAREFFGDRITYRSVRNVASRLSLDDRQAFLATATRFFDRLIDFAESPANDPRMRDPLPSKLWTPMHEALKDAVSAYESRAAGLAGVDAKRAREMQGYAGKADRVAARLEAIATLSDSGSVYFADLQLQRGKRPRVALCSKVINVAPIINSLVWSEVRASVQTSATISVGGSFSFQLNETGVPELDSQTLMVDTPFDFREQCVLVVPETLPEPTGKMRAAWENAAVQEVCEIVRTMGGRTLCLFTTYKMLRAVAERLPRVVPDVEVLVQGEAAMRTKLVERFRANETSVLLGTESFWAGVDVPGRSCSCVVIDKFPFPPPNDPIMDALQEQHGRDTFRRHSIPRAVIQFKQGFGRLVRRSTDRGFVVFLDKRLATKSYGRTFLKSLPDVRKVDALTPRLVQEVAP